MPSTSDNRDAPAGAALDTHAIIQRFYAAIAGGDVPGVVGAMAPDVVLEIPKGPHNAMIPYMGTFSGLDGIGTCGALRDQTTETLEYRVLDIVAEGNRAAVTTFTHARCRETGVDYDVEDIHHLTLSADGKITRWKIYFDSAVEATAFMAGAAARLIAAIEACDIAAADALLTYGANPTARRQDGLTALMVAAGLGRADLVRLLLDHGADPLAKDPGAGASPVHKAAQAGSLGCVKLLIEAGVPVDERATATGHTPLIEAIWFKHPEVVDYLLDNGAGLHVVTSYGFSLLDHMAYALRVNRLDQDRLNQAAELVKKREASDQQATTDQVLMAATTAGDIDRAKALVAGGAEVDQRAPVVNGFNDRHTPLLVACRDGHHHIAEALLAAGADVNATEPTFGAVPLHKATYNGHADITALLTRQTGVNLDYQGPSNGYTPLHDALWHGFDDCAAVLVDAGANLTLLGHDGLRPIDLARSAFGPDHPLTQRIAALMAHDDS